MMMNAEYIHDIIPTFLLFSLYKVKMAYDILFLKVNIIINDLFHRC